MNVLLTSASRKVSLVRAFQAALAATGGGRVIAVDVDPLAAALYVADASALVPRSDDPAFLPGVLDVCRSHAVSLIVPTRDEELPVFAGARDLFGAAGIRVAVSAPEAIATCQDKVRFASFCAAAGFASPPLLDTAGPVEFPLFVKARVGKGGQGAQRADEPAELAWAMEAIRRAGGEPIVQRFQSGREVTIDVFGDFEGRILSALVRERTVVVGGESWVGMTLDAPRLRDGAVALVRSLALIGHVTVQAFELDGSPVFIEVNPRYGGGAALGFAAGLPTPEFLVRAAGGERLEPLIDRPVRELVMLRHTDDLFLPPTELVAARS
jgi:carbamoyl-phosphate synthase large subunit